MAKLQNLQLHFIECSSEHVKRYAISFGFGCFEMEKGKISDEGFLIKKHCIVIVSADRAGGRVVV